jgi:outer membrane protein insertion porin family
VRRSRPCGWNGGRAAVAGLLALLSMVSLPAKTAAVVSPGMLGRPIVDVEIHCEARIDEAGLRDFLPLRVGDLLTESLLGETEDLLEKKRIFDRIEVDAVPQGNGVGVVIRLHRVLVVDSVRVEGYENLRRRDVRRLLRVQPGAIYRREEVSAAAERIRRHYQTLGFVNAKVDPVVYEDDGEVDVTFLVEEGSPLIVADTVIDGEGPWKEELGEIVQEIRGERRTQDAERETTKEIVGRMRELGYYEARVTSVWEPTRAWEGRLRFVVDSGSLFEIDIVGNGSKSRKKLLGLMDLKDRLIITNGTWRELARRMTRAYQDSRFYRVQVDVKIEHNGTKRVRLEVTEGRKYAIRSLRFEGNAHLAEERLIEHMVTQPRRKLPWPHSGALIEEVLSEDVKRVEQFYRTQGFEAAKITDVQREIDDDDGEIHLSIVVDEGPRTVLREMRPADPSQVVGETLELQTQVGEPLSLDAVGEDRRAILSALARRGHAEATVEPGIERSAGGEVVDAVLDWNIEPNTRQQIGRVIVQGNVDTRDLAIRRELPFEPGDPLDVEKLLEGQARLYRTGLFRSAGVEASEAEDGAVRDVVVRVVERPAGILDWGGGYNTRDGFGTFAEVGYKNLWGMARHVSLRGQVSLLPKDFVPDQYLARLGYQAPYVGGTKWRYTGNLLGERSNRDVDKFSLERVDLLNGIDRELWPKVLGGIEADVEHANVFDVEPDAVLSSDDEGVLTTVALGPFLIYDGRDNVFNPRSGVIDSMRWRYALPGVSTVHFLKVNLQHTQLVSLFENVLFLYSARVGWARALDGGDRQVPIRERFFLGGRTTVRGFSENTISPEGEDGDETGGDLAINLNVELQVPLIYGFGAAFFVDGGGVYLQNCDRDCREEKNLSDAAFSIDNFRRAAGFGLRYNTPVGPIALDYGIKLDRKAGESFGEFHFSIGSAF